MIIVVYSGANGAGKSTLFSELDKQLQLPFINPDMIAREKFNDISDEEERYRNFAMPFAEELRKEFIAHGKDFSFETVLSHPSKIEFLNDAINQGYEVYSVYIGTSDPSINVQRVAKRVSEGGHNVNTDKIIARYYRAMDNLPELLNLSEEAVVLDNSDSRPIEILYKAQDKYYLLNNTDVPDWIKGYVIEPMMNKGYMKEYPCYMEAEPNVESLAGVVKNVTHKLCDNNITQGIDEWKREISEKRSSIDSSKDNNKTRNNDDKAR